MINIPEYIPQYYDILILINYLKGLIMNIVGNVYGKWTVIEELERDTKSQRIVRAKCECGTIKTHVLTTIKNSISMQCKSCHMANLNLVDEVVGLTFGKWFVLNRVPNKHDNKRYLCKCECGNQKEVDGYRLRKGLSKSCPKCRVKTHGMCYTDTFRIWAGMFRRCYNSNFKAFKYYGGRGIKVCERWFKFENFLADMGERPPMLQIDRINNDGNYEPDNCRWVTSKVNNANRKNTGFIKEINQ